MHEWTDSFQTFRSTAGDVRWAAFGDPAHEPVVLLHGTPWSSYSWRAVAAALSGRYRVFVWDMPGYGASEKFEGQDVSVGAQGKVFTELLAHWGLDEPLVVGHDFGGAVALRAHLLHGAKYRRLVLADPVALTPTGSEFFRLVRENAEVFGKLPSHLHRALVREYVASSGGFGLHPRVVDALAEPWLGEVGQAAFYRQIAQAEEHYFAEVEARCPELDLPVLICWGAEDRWIPVARADELAALIPGARLRVLPGAGHLVQEDSPAELTAALLEFLGGETAGN
ncbi:alpha/beta fold hydrolase [Amycolatopsis nigrescens]|uniref:alpha/beta fold hydrolase n=1 Tax=Amycolatopsis nigrescens TaxID=381445 RepID=UPI00035CD2DC|nr:alpha/beta hydrolase [Amycolatopsis nigrescens]